MRHAIFILLFSSTVCADSFVPCTEGTVILRSERPECNNCIARFPRGETTTTTFVVTTTALPRVEVSSTSTTRTTLASTTSTTRTTSTTLDRRPTDYERLLRGNVSLTAQVVWCQQDRDRYKKAYNKCRKRK